ncbi:MAG TPA: type II secretion system protein [Gammaproteobacteria bacterium]|jgi:prepilin-type N-terminal cleavage/methylation domain-containing protein|nr:type II secretion system protein [Gammaproteobacteria bacterium]|tara:strand:- start:945 stop:1319 length:375 start_codon:yes stop_codon:yes gene_type:complete
MVSRQAGFNLLEVIVALAITGFLLGGLFTLVGGSKQLSWRSEESLIRATQIRAATNFALLENELNEVELILDNENYSIRPVELLEDPERKTQASVHSLQAYEIVDEDREEIILGSRWVRLELPR